MAGSVNRLELLGRMTRDPELKQTNNGIPYCVLGLATSYRRLNEATKQWEEVPEYHDITIWNQGNRKLAELCARYLKKGRLVWLEGRFRTRSWQDSEGKKRYDRGMAVQDVKLIDPRFNEDGSGEDLRSGANEGTERTPEARSDSGEDAVTRAVAARGAPGEGPGVGGLTQQALDAASSIDPDDQPW